MNKISFLLQYIFKPRTVGAVLPSSRFLARKMVAGINFDDAKCIVEYGPGTGVFTELILEKRNPDTVVILFEMNEDFCRHLRLRFKSIENLYVINSSAAQVGDALQKLGIRYADYVVSGLPFASLPHDMSRSILAQTKKHLSPAGRFITFQYTLLRMDLIGHFFANIEIAREVRNVPPAYVLRCW